MSVPGAATRRSRTESYPDTSCNSRNCFARTGRTGHDTQGVISHVVTEGGAETLRNISHGFIYDSGRNTRNYFALSEKTKHATQGVISHVVIEEGKKKHYEISPTHSGRTRNATQRTILHTL